MSWAGGSRPETFGSWITKLEKMIMFYNLAIYQLAKRKLGDELYANDSDEHTRRNRRAVRKDAPVDSLQVRADLKNELAELQCDGMVPVYVWQRDCDGFARSSVELIPATVMAYAKYEDSEYRNAEGQITVYPISHEEAIEYEPSFRDRKIVQHLNY
tara:strand:- start:138 stop:608 length:471 start_codon:yes stop_codon:yes gene_type:complete